MNYIKNNFSYKEISFSLLLLCVFCGSVFAILSGLFSRIPGISGFSGELLSAVEILIVLFSLSYIRHSVKSSDILLYFGILGVYILQYLIYPNNDKYLSEYFVESMLCTVPMYFIGVSWDVSKFDKLFYYLSIIGILWLSYYYNNLHFDIDTIELQGQSYELLFLLVYLTWYLFRNFNVLGLLVSIIGVFSLFTFAARGPFICYFLFIVLYYLFFYIKKWKSWVFVLLLTVGVLVIYYYDIIVLAISMYLESVGFSTRIVDTLLQGDLTDASAEERMKIISVLQYQLNNGSELSYGLFGSWNYVESYSHRIYWDFWFGFGYIVGSLLMALLVYVLYRGLKSINNSVDKGFWLVLLSTGLLPLFVSGYFVLYGLFFVFLGYNIQMFRKNQTPKQWKRALYR